MEMKIQLKKRQDLFSLLLDFITPVDDIMVVVSIMINLDCGYSSKPRIYATFCVCFVQKA